MVGSLIVPGLTPLMTVGYGNGRLYYGRSDTYKIQVTNLNGKFLASFSLDRGKKRVSDAVKGKYFRRYSSMRKQALDQIIATTPNEAAPSGRDPPPTLAASATFDSPWKSWAPTPPDPAPRPRVGGACGRSARRDDVRARRSGGRRSACGGCGKRSRW